MKQKISKSFDFAGRTLTFETGELASYADSAVKVCLGETVVLVTVTRGSASEGSDFFPLRVDYEERLYAGGLIKGSRFIKREGRPSDEAILGSRLIDRTIRPLFPSDFMDEVQVVATVLSVDRESNPQLVALLGAAAALEISSVPFKGPVGAVYVGKKEGSFAVNPSLKDLSNSPLELLVSATKERVVMLEAHAQELPEAEVLEAISFGHAEVKKFISHLEDFAVCVGSRDRSYVSYQVPEDAFSEIKDYANDRLVALLDQDFDNRSLLNDLVATAVGYFGERYTPAMVTSVIMKLRKQHVRDQVHAGRRIDGRAFDEIRELSAQVGLLPRTHGSALFTRGQTQVLTIATLGSSSLEQLIEGMEGEVTKRYIHHYNAPPFSVGEIGAMRGPGRREIGHGALAEKALVPVLPSEEKFPYTVRLVSEVLSQNGSSSMASTCGSSLALMDAGVPIKGHVAGVSMGLIEQDNDSYILLTDIRGLEDFCGDMDFKIAGSVEGITAIQLDVKNLGLTPAILAEAVSRSKQARLQVLATLEAVMARPRENISVYAPRIFTIKIDQNKIGEVIGSGGRVIKGLIQDTGAEISVEDDGTIVVASDSEEKARKAISLIEGIVKEPEVGEVYHGKVVRIMDFGAFVEILPGKDGLVHISELSYQRVNRVEDIVTLGDAVDVKVIEIDNQGRVNLSIKALQPKPDGFVEEPHSPRGGDFNSRHNHRGSSSHHRRDKFSPR